MLILIWKVVIGCKIMFFVVIFMFGLEMDVYFIVVVVVLISICGGKRFIMFLIELFCNVFML